jgi:L-ascorbate metabolism protein UlaG (beta-lactamase superfamily)
MSEVDATDTPPRPRRWKLWVLVAALALLVGAPCLLVIVGSVYLRHVPYEIPAEWLAPAPPQEPPQGGLTVRWVGVSGFVVSDGQTTLVLDPAVTRPQVTELISGSLGPDQALVDHYFPGPVDYVLVNHAHYDHAIDAPPLALDKGATVVGSLSTVNLCRSRGVPEEQLIEVQGGERLTLGTFTVDVGAVEHSPVLGQRQPMPGVIPADAGDLCFYDYTQDGCRIYRLEGGGATVWFHPTSMYTEGELGGKTAETLIMGVSGAEITPQTMHILREAKPRRIVPTHYDNFFQPLAKGMALLPMIDMAATRQLMLDADPDLDVWLLDYDQTIYLPPDPVGKDP